MHKYWLIFKLAILDIFEYRVDFALMTFKYAFMLMMMAFVWVAVARSQPSLELSANQIIQYFVFVSVVYTLSNFHTDNIEFDIKLGQFSTYLLKPLSPFLYYYSFLASQVVVETTLKVLVMLPIAWYLGYFPSISLDRLVLFLCYLPLVYTFAFHQFTLISGLSFWIDEAFAIRWTLTMFFRLTSGILVPLTFYSPEVQTILLWTPFPHLAFTPVQIIQGKMPLSDGWFYLATLAAWIVVFAIARNWLWGRGYQKYEGVAI